MNLHSYLYEQSGGIEANIRSRRPMLAEAMRRGDKEEVRVIQAMNRRALEI
jgi:hypothetical protein